jgi:hypothetical protein
MDLGTAAKDLPDKCQLIDQRLKELATAEKKPKAEYKKPGHRPGVEVSGLLTLRGCTLKGFKQLPIVPA